VSGIVTSVWNNSNNYISYPNTLHAHILSDIEKEQQQAQWNALQIELNRLNTDSLMSNTKLWQVYYYYFTVFY
jgi:hypothetical protein